MWNKLYKNKKLDVWLDISTYCNAACPQCHRTSPRTADKADWLPLIQWSLDQFKSAFPIQSMIHIHRFQLCGTWGDPIMNRDVYSIIEYIVKYSNCKVVLNTNGSLRDPLWWWQLGFLLGDRGSCYFCIDGSDQEMHERYRQKTDLSLVLENMEAFSEFSKSNGFTIVFKHNENYLKDIYDLAKKYGAEDHCFIPSDRAHHHDTFKYMDPEGNLKFLEHSPKYGRQPQRASFKVEDIND